MALSSSLSCPRRKDASSKPGPSISETTNVKNEFRFYIGLFITYNFLYFKIYQKS